MAHRQHTEPHNRRPVKTTMRMLARRRFRRRWNRFTRRWLEGLNDPGWWEAAPR